jgi:hypothetical protein
MMRVDISADMSRARDRLRLAQREVDPAAVRALNRTITTVRADAVQKLKPEYPGLKAGALRARMKLERANRSTLTAGVVFAGRRIQVYGNFGMRTSGRFGVRFSKLPWRVEDHRRRRRFPAELLARAFRNRLRRSGRAAVFSRWGARSGCRSRHAGRARASPRPSPCERKISAPWSTLAPPALSRRCLQPGSCASRSCTQRAELMADHRAEQILAAVQALVGLTTTASNVDRGRGDEIPRRRRRRCGSCMGDDTIVDPWAPQLLDSELDVSI